jgi:hypothetical protein
MERLNLKPTHKAVQNYYEALHQFKNLGVSHEGAVRSAFQNLLELCGRQFHWKLVSEWPIKQDRGNLSLLIVLKSFVEASEEPSSTLRLSLGLSSFLNPDRLFVSNQEAILRI